MNVWYYHFKHIIYSHSLQLLWPSWQRSMFFSITMALLFWLLKVRGHASLLKPTDQLSQDSPAHTFCHFCHGSFHPLFSECLWYSPDHLFSGWTGLMSDDPSCICCHLVPVSVVSLSGEDTSFQPLLCLESLILSTYSKCTPDPSSKGTALHIFLSVFFFKSIQSSTLSV